MKKSGLALIVLILIALALAVSLPASAVRTEEGSVSGSLTRGSPFTVTITGLPNTSYYVWLPRTFVLTGQPGDRPPVISENQYHVTMDPVGGPYTIGLYQYNNGDGRTILDDVAPATASMSNTRYYALVTTDNDGHAVVEFSTSFDTALRSYSVKVENPDSVNKDILLVEGRAFSRTAPGIQPTERPATAAMTALPPDTTRTPTPAQSPTPEITQVYTTTGIPDTAEQQPSPSPLPTHRTPVSALAGGIALIFGWHLVQRRHP